MTNPNNADVGCLLVGEYVEQAQVSDAFAHLRNASRSKAEVERPRIVASYVDQWSSAAKSFTVLLRDKRVLTVTGHALRYVQNASNPSDYGSYGIILRAAGEGDVLVALFPVSEVTGIFSGAIQTPRESA